MAVSGRNIDDNLTRLVSLETSSRKVYEELMPLQRENASLMRDNMVLKREIDTMREDISKMKKDTDAEKYQKQKEIDNLREEFKKLKKDTEAENYQKQKEIDTLREDLFKIKKDLEVEKCQKQKNIDRLDKKLSTVENDMKAAHRKHDDNHKTMTKDMKTFSSKTEASERKIEHRMSQLLQIHTVLNRAMVECHKDGDVKERGTDLSKRIKSLEEISDQVSSSFFDVLLDTSSGTLPACNYKKLNRCVIEHVNLGGFNTKSCCLQPKTTGRYVVSVRFCQTFDGHIKVRVRGSDDESEIMGETVRADDMVTGLAVVTIESIPYNLWVEAWRGERQAFISQCRLSSWKLCDV